MTNTPKTQDDIPAELEHLVDVYVRQQIRWYQRRKATARRLHRLSTVSLVGLGAFVPVLSTLESSWSHIVVSISGVTISVIAGLSSTYKWDRTWHVFTEAQMTLEAALAEWELEVLTIADDVTEDAPRQGRLTSATKELLRKTNAALSTESHSFFREISRTARSREIAQE